MAQKPAFTVKVQTFMSLSFGEHASVVHDRPSLQV
jgi:hypothetical protein